MRTRQIPRRRPTLMLAVFVAAAASASHAATLRNIAIDGDMSDWSEVLLASAQTVADRSQAQGDPDAPSQSQRDIRGVAVTWDAQDLNLYFSRTGSGTNSFNLVFYIDLDHDGLLSGTDRIAFMKFVGGGFGGMDLHAYADGGTPDPITGDGVTPAGAAGALVTTAGASAAGDASGIRFEMSIAWASLGVAPGTPLFIHPALSTNKSLPSGVADNTVNLDTFLPGVAISASRATGTAPGRSVTFSHRITNTGTAADVLDVEPQSLMGSRIELLTDPNGDGDPADGRLVGVDAAGDGDFSDTADTRPAPADDANSNGLADIGSLASGAFRNLVLRVTPSASAPVVSEDVLRVLVVSGYRPAVRAQVEDRLRIGFVTVAPARAVQAAPGLVAWLAHEACNDSGATRVLEAAAAAPPGWTVVLHSDPDGDGDPQDGAPLTDSDGDGMADLGSLADGACASFVAVAGVPAGASGNHAIVSSAFDGALGDSRDDAVEVLSSSVDFAPDHAAPAQPGKTVFFSHHVVNAGALAELYTLSSASSLGSSVTFLDDPNGDGEPSDSSVITATPAVQAQGGVSDVIVRIRVPTTAVDGDTDVVSLSATGSSSGIVGVATDTLDIRGLLSYSDPFHARPATTFFGQCATVHALAFRPGNSTYRFVWLDGVGTIVRLSADLTPYSDGSLDDFLSLTAAPALGTWTVKLQVKGGSTYTDVPGFSQTFEVLDLVSGGAAITTLTTGADIYEIAGEDFHGVVEVSNPTSADVLDSVLEHVVFQDANLDGQPSAGEIYVRADGTTDAWSAGLFTARDPDADVLAGQVHGDRITVPDVGYGSPGPWLLHVTWTASCGYLLATDSVAFTVGCQPPPSFAGVERAADVDPCTADGIVLEWSPAASWGLGTTGTYAIYRSEDLGFTPGPATLLVSGLLTTSHVDTTVVVGVTYAYVVRAESDVTCSTGPANGGLEDGNSQRRQATDDVLGAAPQAAFVHTAPRCFAAAGTTVDFIDVSTGPPADWEWDFDGDGVVDSTSASPSHDYAGPGTYVARLTVSSACGTSTTSMDVVIHAVPLALVQANRTETCANEPVDFDGTASSAPAGIASAGWDFDGDGDTDSTDLDPAPFTYPSRGSFTARLTVTDANGCEDAEDVPVVVHDSLVLSVAPPVVGQCTGEVTLTATSSGGDGAPAFTVSSPFVEGMAGTFTATLPPGVHDVAVSVIDGAGCTASTSVRLVMNEALTAVVAAPVVNACTGEVAVTVDVAGGAGGYTFSSPGLSFVLGPTQAVGTGVFAPGTHAITVSVTDGAGCKVDVQAPAFDVPVALGVAFVSRVDYVYPDEFAASLTAAATGGTAPFTYTWDVGADGSPDGTGDALTHAMGANETVRVLVTVTDGNGCTAAYTADVASDGCPATDELTMLRVRKAGTGYVMTWDASVHSCHGRYGVLEAQTARPASGDGTFPTDPAWQDLRAEDGDGSDLDASFTLVGPRAAPVLFYLVRDGGTDGSWGPTGHYGNTGVTPAP